MPRKLDVSADKVPKPLGLPLHYDYANRGDPKYFREVFEKSSNKKAERNAILFELMSIVDDEYDVFEKNVRADRAYKDIFVTIGSIAMTAVAAAEGGGAAKTLAAIDTGLKGSNAAIDKHAFGDAAPVILLNQMRTNRATVAKAIYEGMGKTVALYTLDEGIRDVANYFRAGSVTAAVIALGTKTAQSSQEAQDEASSAKFEQQSGTKP